MANACLRVDLGGRRIIKKWRLQRQLVTLRGKGAIPDVLLLVEHPPTYTLGRGGQSENLLADERELERLGAKFVLTDRGGDITFHGDGQLVGYAIVDLKEMEPDVHVYLRRLEEVLIRTLARFGVEASRQPGLTGVWHQEGKLAAIGVRVARWVTSHGFALNVSTDLSYFNRIVPCGIVGREVASMESVLGRAVPLDPVRDAVCAEFGRVFERTMLASTFDSLLQGSHVEVWKRPAS
jgi:lipoate-protein ligase B